MVTWFRQQRNQCVLHNIIREFVVFCTACIPALRDSMVERHEWDLVEDNCYNAMDQFRKHVDSVHGDGSVRWFKGIREVLADFDTHHLRFQKCAPNPRLFIEKMAEECINFDDSTFGDSKYREQLFSQDEQRCLQVKATSCKATTRP